MKTIQPLILVLLMGTIHNALANPCPANNKYAQAPDGCSSWSNNPQQVRDTWGPVDFRQACNEHDKCYYTLGSTEASCNDAFNKRLLTACRDGLRKCGKTFWGDKWCSPPEPVSYTTCAGIAEAMYVAVRGASRSVYRKAQDKQRKHEQQCAATESPKPGVLSNGSLISASGESGLCLDAKNYGAHKKGNDLHLWACNGEIHQNWVLTTNGEIISDGGKGLCLDAKNYGARKRGNPLHLWPCNGEIHQKWLLTSNNELISAGGENGLCIDAKSYGAYNNGNELHLWTCNGEIHQKWRFK